MKYALTQMVLWLLIVALTAVLYGVFYLTGFGWYGSAAMTVICWVFTLATQNLLARLCEFVERKNYHD